jgi:hypothetical protein
MQIYKEDLSSGFKMTLTPVARPTASFCHHFANQFQKYFCTNLLISGCCFLFHLRLRLQIELDAGIDSIVANFANFGYFSDRSNYTFEIADFVFFATFAAF